MLQKTIDRFNEVNARVAKEGITVEAACKDAKMGLATYYAAKKAGLVKQKKASKKKTARFIDMPIKTVSANVAVVVCQPNQLKDILAGLQ